MERDDLYKYLSIVCFLALVVLSVLLYKSHQKPPVQAPAPITPPTVEAQAPAEALPLVSREAYEALRYDMTYEEVLGIIGELETSRKTDYDKGVEGYTGPKLTLWCVWLNPDGSEVTLGFVQQKLMEKREKDLPE